jgi:putative ABC transport system permease protein
LGIFLLFKGLGTFIGHLVRKKSKYSAGLYTFTGRQLQENVLNQSKSLTVSSLLVLLAMICVSFGVGGAIGSGASVNRTTDFSFQGSQIEVEKVLNSEEIRPYVHSYYPMYIDSLRSHNSDVDKGHEFSWSGLRAAVESLPDSSTKQGLVDNLADRNHPHLISLGSYNNMRKTTGMQEIILAPGEVALYTAGEFVYALGEFQRALQKQAFVTIDGVEYPLVDQLQSDNLVADRSINIMLGLIVPDEMYKAMAEDREPFCWNMVMKPEYIKENGLMQGMQYVNSLLSKTGIEYESYLKSMGRQLFYVVAGSYLTLYIGVLFLIIANTVLGLKFLMQQRSTRGRYEALLTLGAKEDELCASARTQIRMFFGLVISTAVVSSIFGIWAMFTSFLRLPNSEAIHKIIPIASGALVLFVLLEIIYIRVIE